MEIGISIEAIVYGVPGVLIVGGILLLVTGYPLNFTNEISGGWSLITIGVLIYLIEILVSFIQKGGFR